MQRRPVALAVGLVVVLGAGALAHNAFASWGPPRTVEHDIQRAVGNARGEQLFTWQSGTNERVMLGDSPYTASFPLAQLRRADGTLGRPQTLTATHGIVANAGEVGLDDRGAATVLWTRTTVGALRLMGSIRPPGGRFGGGSEIAHVRWNQIFFEHHLSVAPDGSAVVVWADGRRLYASQRPPGRCAPGAPRACFGARQKLFGGRCPVGIENCFDGLDAAVSAGPGGRAFVAYAAVKRTSSGFRTLVRLAAARPGRRFGTPKEISDPGDVALGARVARVRGGGAAVTWVTGATVARHRIVGVFVDGRGAPRGRPAVLSGRTCVAALLRVSVQNELTAAWICEGDSELDHISIAASTGPATGPFAPSVDLGRRDYASTDALGLDARGDAVLVYSPDGKTTVTRVRPPGGAFGAPLTVPRPLRGRQRVEPGGRLVEAGPRLTLLQYFLRGKTLLRDWAQSRL